MDNIIEKYNYSKMTFNIIKVRKKFTIILN